MFVDTSALVAILTREKDAAVLASALEAAATRHTSPLVRLETCTVLATKLDITPSNAEAIFDQLLEEAGIEILPIDDNIGRLAVRCFETYGKGRHPAKLNIVDCFSYACAKVLGAPLLFKGEDFSLTDVN